jgi:hypothetical protein
MHLSSENAVASEIGVAGGLAASRTAEPASADQWGVGISIYRTLARGNDEKRRQYLEF